MYPYLFSAIFITVLKAIDDKIDGMPSKIAQPKNGDSLKELCSMCEAIKIASTPVVVNSEDSSFELKQVASFDSQLSASWISYAKNNIKAPQFPLYLVPEHGKIIEDVKNCFMEAIKEIFEDEYYELELECMEMMNWDEKYLDEFIRKTIDDVLRALEAERASIHEMIMFLSLIMFRNLGPRSLLANLSIKYNLENPSVEVLSYHGITRLKRSQAMLSWIRNEGTIPNEEQYDLCRYLDYLDDYTIALEVKYFMKCVLSSVYLNNESSVFLISLFQKYDQELFTEYSNAEIMDIVFFIVGESDEEEERKLDFIRIIKSSVNFYSALSRLLIKQLDSYNQSINK